MLRAHGPIQKMHDAASEDREHLDRRPDPSKETLQTLRAAGVVVSVDVSFACLCVCEGARRSSGSYNPDAGGKLQHPDVRSCWAWAARIVAGELVQFGTPIWIILVHGK